MGKECKVKDIIKPICDEKGIECTLLSKDWIIRLKKNGEYRYIAGSNFSLNPQSSSNIASDKYATYEVIKSLGIPVIEHKMLFNPKYKQGYVSDFENFSEIEEYYNKQENGKLILKGNHGDSGRQVYLCNSVSDIEKNIEILFEHSESISICPFYDIAVEYRIIYLDGECLLTFGKYKDQNSWKFNLCQGAEAKILEDGELKDHINKMAIEIAKAMNLRFASIDIIQTTKGEILLLEVNSGVTLNRFAQIVEGGEEIAKEIYSKAIDKMFE